MQTAANVASVAYVIQLAVAPVFLLTGVGAILTVLINRLARVVDRFRVLSNLSSQEQSAYKQEMTTLSHRARWVHWAVSLCTVSALLICIVVAALFVGSETSLDPSRAISLLFIFAMLALILGLLCFMREIFLATGNIEHRTKERLF